MGDLRKGPRLGPLANAPDSIPKIPAWEYLGHSVSLILPQSPFNVNDVLESTENYGIVNPVWADEEVLIPGIETPYRIPNNFRLEVKGTETKYHDLLVEPGSSLSEKASTDASIRASYFGVNATAADYQYGATIGPNRIYGLFTLEQITYSVSLSPQLDTWDNIDETLLLAIQQLPSWIEADDDVQKTWREFFDSWGTHIVLEIFYGNRYQLRVVSPDSPSLSPERWAACIEANYSEIIPATVEPATDEELAIYNKSKTSVCYVFGGNREKAMSLVTNHASKQKLDDWADSLASITDSIINIKVKSIHTLLRESPKSDHKNAAEKIEAPLNFFLDVSPTPTPPPPPLGEYVISVENKRGEDTTYAFFMDRPQFTGGEATWMNVWYSSHILNNGSFDFRSEVDCYAWVGVAPTIPGPGVVLQNGMSQLARLGTENEPGSTFEMKIVSRLPTIEEIFPSTGISGAYEVKTGTDFTLPNKRYLVGIGKTNHRGQVVPIASVTPKMKFFVSESEQLSSEIVDYSAVSRDGANIDFSSGEGLGKYYASVVQHDDGRFEVTYHDT